MSLCSLEFALVSQCIHLPIDGNEPYPRDEIGKKGVFYTFLSI
jgi:hypothetical protein